MIPSTSELVEPLIGFVSHLYCTLLAENPLNMLGMESFLRDKAHMLPTKMQTFMSMIVYVCFLPFYEAKLMVYN